MAHLTKEDRLRIENMLNAGASATEMSRNLGKSHTMFSREIRNIRHKQFTMKNNLQEVILRKYHLDISSLSSYIKKQYDDVPAIRRFESIYGKNFLAAIGISLIAPKLVTMDPILLKGKSDLKK